ncbi:potassium transporter KtrA [candidate division KSB3 bacterium]|uniref:Potassium transporter KtrA n=1 Tax=candidate division KSB3 bacterium TaxID=2044937 RepID=A0A2G6E2G8_9BACT|nr:MAG: potassium transporter KtrA [candidate division KSB3 bacterium]PIE28812.1 MAG: potassium transporter KtrA [candidate division KSB3 bacterium]
MKKRIAVIGLGSFGRSAAITLTQMGVEVIAIDKDFENVDSIKDDVLIAIQVDGTDQESLEEQDLQHVDAAVVAIGTDFEETLLTVAALKKLGVPKVVSRARTRIRKDILEQVGCDRVVLPEEEVGHNVAKELISDIFFDRIELGKDHSIAQLVAPEAMLGNHIDELRRRLEDYQLNIVTIKRQTPRRNFLGQDTVEHIISVPKADDMVLEGDILVLFGHDKNLREFADDVDTA